MKYRVFCEYLARNYYYCHSYSAFISSLLRLFLPPRNLNTRKKTSFKTFLGEVMNQLLE